MKPILLRANGQLVLCADVRTPGVQMAEAQAITLPEYQEYLRSDRVRSTWLFIASRDGSDRSVVFPVDILTQASRALLSPE